MSAKWGMFGKSFNDIGTAIKDRWVDFNNEFERTRKISDSFKNTDSIWKRLYGNKADLDWYKNGAGDIVTKDNIDAYIPELDTDAAREKLISLQTLQKEINATQGSWDDYNGSFKKSEKYLIDYARANNVLESSVDDVKAANQSARQAAIAHNAALKQQTLGAKAATAGMKALSIAGNMLLFMGISMAISAITKSLDDLVHAQENAIEKADEAISKFEEQRDALTSTKNTIDEISSDYERLSQGVDSLGRNVSLNTEEYARYNEIVNKIAGMFPQMIQGYTDEGNAIIAHKGNVEELTKAYEEQKKAAQDATIVGSAAVFKGYKTKVDFESTWAWEKHGLLQTKDFAENVASRIDDRDALENYLGHKPYNDEIYNSLYRAMGVTLKPGEYTNSAKTILNYADKLPAAIRTLESQIETETAKIKPIMQAYLEQSFEFQGLDDKTQDVIKQIVGQFNSEFYTQFKDETEMANWVTENVVNKLKDDTGKEISLMLDMQTKFNNNEITVAEYQEKLSALLSIIDTLPEDTQKAVKLLFGISTDGNGNNFSDFDTLLNSIKKKLGGKFEKEISGLKLGDLEILSGILANPDISDEDLSSWESISKLMEESAEKAKEATAAFSEVSKELDTIQSAYDDLKAAKEQYDKDGYLSVDNMQKIMSLGDDYLQYLTDENGQLKLNEQAFIDLTKAKIQDLMLSAVSEYNSWVQGLQNEGTTVKELTEKYQKLNDEREEFVLGEIYTSYEDANGDVFDLTQTSQYQNMIAKYNLYRSVIDGLGKGGLSSDSSSSSGKKLERLNHSIKTNQLLLDKYTNILSTLDTKLDMLSDKDYDDKLKVTSDKISALSAQTAAMRNEFDRLNAIKPNTSEEADALASQMEKLHGNIVDNIKTLRECYTEIENIKHEAFVNLSEKEADDFSKSIEAIEKSLDNVQKKYTRNGSLDLFNLNSFLPDTPESAIENKKREAEKLEAEEKKYYAAIEKIQKTSLDKQYEAKLKQITDTNGLVKDSEKVIEDASNHATETILKNVDKVKNAVNTAAKNGVLSADDWIRQYTGTGLINPDGKSNSNMATPLSMSNAAKNVTGKTQGGDSCVRYARARVQEITGHGTGAALTYESKAKTYGYNLNGRVTDPDSKAFRAALVPGAVISMNNGKAKNAKGELYGHVIVVENYDPKTDTLTYSDSTTGTKAKTVNLTNYLKQKNITGVVPPTAYAEGTNYHKGGLALVGEDHKDGRKGGAELAQLPDGQLKLLGTNGAELYDLPRGTKILNHGKTEKLIPSYAEGTGGVDIDPTQELIDSLETLIKSVANGYAKEYAEYQAKATSAYNNYNDNITSVRSKYSNGELSRDEAMSLIEDYEREVTLSNYSLAFSSIGMELSRGKEELQSAIDYYNNLIERSNNGELIDESVFENWRTTISDIQSRVEDAEDRWNSVVDGMYDTFDATNRKLTSKNTDVITSNDRMMELTENRLSGETDKSVLIKDSLGMMELSKANADEARKAMDSLHNQADELRNGELGKTLSSMFDTESWFNSNGELNSNFDADWEFADEKTRELMAEYAQNMSSLKKQHGELQDSEIDYLNKVKDLRSEIIGYAQEAYEDAYDKQVEAIEKANDKLDIQISKQQALLDAQESCNDANKSLRDSFQEIEAELASSKALSDYLDPTAREGLFNESDYKKLARTIDSVKSNISDIYAWYEKQINSLGEDDIYQQEYITEEFNRRLASEQNRYALAEKEVDLEKKKVALQNTLANKNEKMFVGGAWVNIANTQSVINAQKDYQNARLAYENQQEDNKQDAKFAKIQAKIDKLSLEKSKNEYDITLLQKASDEAAKKLEELISPSTDLAAAFGALASSFDGKVIEAADILSMATAKSDTIAPKFIEPNSDINYQKLIEESNSAFFNYVAERERNQKIIENLLPYAPTYNFTPLDFSALIDTSGKQEMINQAIVDGIACSGYLSKPNENYYIDKFNVKTDEPTLVGVLTNAKKMIKYV